MIQAKIGAVLIKCASGGLGKKHLGQSLAQVQAHLEKEASDRSSDGTFRTYLRNLSVFSFRNLVHLS